MDKLLKAAALAATLGGCTLAEFDSINTRFNPSAGDSRFIDIKQRAVYAVQTPLIDPFTGTTISFTDAHGRKSPLKRTVVCAEPSPDALQTTALALGGNVSAEEIKLALGGAAGLSNSGASVGLRTQSIQLLRDAYYRLCEGFANRAMDDVAFNVLQQRFQNHMIALLAVEQLTGATVAAQATTKSTAAGDAGANVAALANAARTSAETRTELEAEKTALQAQIDSKSVAPADEEADAKAIREKQVADLNKKMEGLNRQIKTETEILQNLQSAIAKASGDGPSASSSADASLGSQRSNENPSQLPAHVSAAVAAITLNSLNQDYGLQLCVELSREVFTKGHAAAIATRGDSFSPGQTIGRSVESLKVSQTMLEYCGNRLRADAEMHRARAQLTNQKSAQVANIVNRLTSRRITASEAASLFKALNVAIPDTPDHVYAPDFTGLVGQQCPAGQGYDPADKKCKDLPS